MKRFLRPRKDVDAKYPNAIARERLPSLLVITREDRTVNRVSRRCIIFRHDDFPNIELYCVDRYAMVIKEGSPADYFYQVEDDGEEPNDIEVDAQQKLPQVGNSDLDEGDT